MLYRGKINLEKCDEKNHPPILKERKVGSINKLSSCQKDLGG
jgi:hypothetical protein